MARTMAQILLPLLGCILAALFIAPIGAWAADLDSGAKVFSANCAACHAGGGNLVNAAKTLKKETLHQYQMDSLDAIQTQVTQGKNAMPAFQGRLTAEQIEAVAAYVLDQSSKDWQ